MSLLRGRANLGLVMVTVILGRTQVRPLPKLAISPNGGAQVHLGGPTRKTISAGMKGKRRREKKKEEKRRGRPERARFGRLQFACTKLTRRLGQTHEVTTWEYTEYTTVGMSRRTSRGGDLRVTAELGACPQTLNCYETRLR